MNIARSRALFLFCPLLLAAASGSQANECSLTPTPGLTSVMLGLRTYQLYVPESVEQLEPGTRVPFILSLHGLAGSGSNHGPRTGWIEFSETRPMVLAFPDGDRKWDMHEDSIDVAFLREVIADVSSTYCIDAARVHVTGHSNGSFMAQRLACDAYDLVASIAPYAGGRPDNSLQGGPCRPKRPVPVALFHGDADATVSVEQGRSTRDGWVDRLDCDTVPIVTETTDGIEEVYPACDGGAEVRWHVYPGQPHAWPEGERRDDLRERIWTFFERFPHPAPWDEGTSLPSNEPVVSQDEDLKAKTSVELLSPVPVPFDSPQGWPCAPPKASRLPGSVGTEIQVAFRFTVGANTVGNGGTAVPTCETAGPLSHRLVHLWIGDGPMVHATTDDQGLVSATLAAPAAPGDVEIRARFDGDDLTVMCPAGAARFKQTVYATP
jgi:polyhydroxybutyrate depolymerase